MLLRALLAALALSWLISTAADAQQVYGPLSNCSGTVGTTAAPVAFPSSGNGGAAPQVYLIMQNNNATADIWINALPSGVATTTQPSLHIFPGSSFIWNGPIEPVPLSLSIIASAASSTYTCWYR
jgi:hypothetical protein